LCTEKEKNYFIVANIHLKERNYASECGALLFYEKKNTSVNKRTKQMYIFVRDELMFFQDLDSESMQTAVGFFYIFKKHFCEKSLMEFNNISVDFKSEVVRDEYETFES
jgi:hypothetical protein